MNHFGDREISNSLGQQTQQSKVETNILDIVKNLSTLFIQDEELTKHQRYIGHEEFNKLVKIKQELQGRGGLNHDISTLLGEALGGEKGDFDTQRDFIQSDADTKKVYKEKIENSINTIKLIEQDKPIGVLISDLITLNTDFSNDLKTKNLGSKINNKQGELYLLAIAYNLYNNAARFNIRDGEIFISISNRGDMIVISAHNISSQLFSESNKEAILYGTISVDSEEGIDNKKGQGIYLADLNKTLKKIGGGITINNNTTASGHHTTIIVMIPKQS